MQKSIYCNSHTQNQAGAAFEVHSGTNLYRLTAVVRDEGNFLGQAEIDIAGIVSNSTAGLQPKPKKYSLSDPAGKVSAEALKCALQVRHN
jgi:hypothetical protein